MLNNSQQPAGSRCRAGWLLLPAAKQHGSDDHSTAGAAATHVQASWPARQSESAAEVPLLRQVEATCAADSTRPATVAGKLRIPPDRARVSIAYNHALKEQQQNAGIRMCRQTG